MSNNRRGFGEQLPFDFGASASQRIRNEKMRQAEQPLLFAAIPADIDVHLHSPQLAVATLGADPESSRRWLESVVGPCDVIKGRRVAFPVKHLDRLLAIRPPAKVTLDGACTAVARALWADALGLGGLRVTKAGRRIVASSPRWPAGMNVKDAPWTAVAACIALGLPLDIDPRAAVGLTDKLGRTGQTIAHAGLAGSSVHLVAHQPQLLEEMKLPALAYAGSPTSGEYRMPLLAAEPLLYEPTIELTPELRSAIKRATGRPKPLANPDGFPWTLYPFQANDGGKGLRSLENAGGVLLAGDMGSGKSTPVITPVWTEVGRVQIGDLCVGDRIFGRDGRLHNVTGVFPQGRRQLYRVAFSDGSSLEACAEHLWAAQSPVQKKRGRPGKVLSTQQLLDGGLRDAAGNCRWYIPVTDPVQFNTPEELPLPGYVLGVLLGDGSFSSASVKMTNNDIDSLEAVMSDLLTWGFDGITHAVHAREGKQCETWRIQESELTRNRVRDALRSLDLVGKRSWEKFVPRRYLYAPEHVRRALLQGLLDTDGGVCDKRSPSSVEFCSTSEQLVDDVRWLVMSLGGTARKSKPRRTTYTHNGEKKLGRPSWRLSLQLPDHVEPFRCARKKALYRPRVKYQPTRAIVSIEPTTVEETVCISIDAPDQLYLAGDELVVTHNTTISLALVATLDIWPLLVVSPLAAFSTWARQLGEMGKNYYLASEAPKVAWEKISSGEHDAVVISYDRLHAFVELLEQMGFAGVVADELQRISSPGSRRSRALRQLAAAFPLRIGLSGTPMSNTLGDLLPLGSFLVPGEWKPRANAKDLADLYPGDPVEAVAEHLGTLMVRRRMDEVGVELPDKIQRRVFVQLTPEQRRALEDLQREAEEEVEEGAGRMHVFAKLQKMRQIVNCPAAAGVSGPNPKIRTAVELALEFNEVGRKSVLFCADRQSWKDLGAACDEAGLPWVGIWGSSSVPERLEAERRFHQDDNVRVFIGTLQSCAESLTLSPTGTVWITTSYLYNPSALAQAEARVYRLSSDKDGPPIEIIYLHAQVPGGGLDDRMVEILEAKRALISQVVDRRSHVDQTNVHYSLGDLVYLLTGKRDETIDAREADNAEAMKREQAKKDLAKATAHKRKHRNRADIVHDDGSTTMTLEEYQTLVDDVDDHLDDEDALADTGVEDEDGFADELDDGDDDIG